MNAEKDSKDKKLLIKYGVCIHLLQQNSNRNKVDDPSVSINWSPGESRKKQVKIFSITFLLTRSYFRIFDDGVSFSIKDLETTSRYFVFDDFCVSEVNKMHHIARNFH